MASGLLPAQSIARLEDPPVRPSTWPLIPSPSGSAVQPTRDPFPAEHPGEEIEGGPQVRGGSCRI